MESAFLFFKYTNYMKGGVETICLPLTGKHTVHFPGTTRANCSIASPLGVLAELQTLSVFAFKHVQNLPQNFK